MRASIVLFLSSGLISESCAALIEGGYSSKTKTAMVYKASWPEQRILRGTLETLPSQAKEAGIKNTALILVGDFLGDEYELSKLYDKTFTHAFRKGTE